MYSDIYAVFPEISWIGDEKLRRQVAETLDDAMVLGGWKYEDLDTMPFTLKMTDNGVSYRKHIRVVTRMARLVYEEYKETYGDDYPLRYDVLIAGALIHDVGKFVEYTTDEKGNLTLAKGGKIMRHPTSGYGLAVKHGLPEEICHIVAYHAHEGDGVYRIPEAVLVNKLDMLNWDSIKAHRGLI